MNLFPIFYFVFLSWFGSVGLTSWPAWQFCMNCEGRTVKAGDAAFDRMVGTAKSTLTQLRVDC